jgi:ankyrin repeat protein
LTVAACTRTPSRVIVALVNGGALLDFRAKDGSTAMHRAVERNSYEAVKTLLDLGASPNYRDSRGLTPLYIAVAGTHHPPGVLPPHPPGAASSSASSSSSSPGPPGAHSQHHHHHHHHQHHGPSHPNSVPPNNGPADAMLCEALLHDHAVLGAQDLQGWQEVHQVSLTSLQSTL